jgi:hypothetical protein
MSYGAAIVQGISEARMMVVVLSNNANLSRHVAKEVERAVSKGLPVIPFRIEEVLPTKDLEYFLSAEHWLDAIKPPLEEHLQKLGNTVTTLMAAYQPKAVVAETKEQRARLAQQFQEIAPDEWRWQSRRGIIGWLKNFLTEKS